MGITQIGNRLIRTFGSGANLKKVVTETIDGKTFTKVLDAEGKEVVSRVKQISRYNVGDKKVVTKTTVSGVADNGTKKTVTDRVYNQEGNFLGYRKVTANPVTGKKLSVSKMSANDGIEISKMFGSTGKTLLRRALDKNDYRHAIMSHNRKGLPVPEEMNGSQWWSLAGMRQSHLIHHSDVPFANPLFKLQALDKSDGNIKLNHLDEFI